MVQTGILVYTGALIMMKENRLWLITICCTNQRFELALKNVVKEIPKFTECNKFYTNFTPPLIKSHLIQLWLSDQLPSRSSSHSSKTGLAYLGMIYFTCLGGLIHSSEWLITLLMIWRILIPSFNTLPILCKLQVSRNEKYKLNGAHFKQSKYCSYSYAWNIKKYGRKFLYTDIENFQISIC